jgi:hypothetical protein
MRKAFTSAAFLAVLACDSVAHAEPFNFIALGDTPYNIPADYEKFQRLIGFINQAKPSFSIHVGDIKSGGTLCSEENYAKVAQIFAIFEQPLVYTPGDNEWTDCHRPAAGGYDPLERLAKLRAMFFGIPSQSLGKAPMPVESQANVMPIFAKYVENTRFEKDGVLFLTIHVVGSNNGFEARQGADQPQTTAAYFERDRANVAWLKDGFDAARLRQAKAIIIAMQADPYDTRQATPGLPLASGFRNIVEAITRGAHDFKRPILVIHGDAHRMELARFQDIDMKPIPGVWRLEVMGEKDVHAIRVTVDPDDPSMFSFKPLIVPENGPY